MCAFFAAMMIGLLPNESVAVDHVDVIEVNHFYDHSGRLVFDQVIFWQWDESAAQHQVSAWRMLKSPQQIPQRDAQRGDYVSIWNDGTTLRKVRAKSKRESWTQTDPELNDRQTFSVEARRELIGAKR